MFVVFLSIIFSVAVLAGIVLLLHYIATQFYQIACEKGWCERKYYVLSFLLGAVGWLLVIALPDRNVPPVAVAAPASIKQVDSDELPSL